MRITTMPGPLSLGLPNLGSLNKGRWLSLRIVQDERRVLIGLENVDA
jgi:hypothetical protein